MTVMTPLEDEVRALVSAQITRVAERSFNPERSRAESVSITPEEWAALAETGLFALGIGPEFGGLGGEARDWGMVMRELGRNLSPLPYLDSTVLATWLISALAQPSSDDARLSRIAGGLERTAWAHSEPGAGNERHFIETRWSQGRVSGTKTSVLDADGASAFLVTAKDDTGQLVVARVKNSGTGLSQQSYRLPDNRRAANLSFSSTPGELVGKCPTELLDRALDLAAVCMAADSVGASEALNRFTLDYAKTRQQFGQPIGGFQVIQHRLADMYIAQRTAAAMVDEALGAFDSAASNAGALCSAAKAHADRAAFEIAQGAIQIHGGMGLTDECAAGLYLKRIMVNASLHGTAAWHLPRAAA